LSGSLLTRGTDHPPAPALLGSPAPAEGRALTFAGPRRRLPAGTPGRDVGRPRPALQGSPGNAAAPITALPIFLPPLATRLRGGAGALQRGVVKIIRGGGHHYSLSHALLAGLPVREVVTTNYDRLFETAWEAAAAEPLADQSTFHVPCRTSVIPHDIQPHAARWLLKLHG
jgi:hypothetical protein